MGARRSWTGLAAALLALAMSIVATACGSDDTQDGASPPSDAVTPTDATTTSAPVASSTEAARFESNGAGATVGFGEVDADQLERLRSVTEDAPFYMVNLLAFRDEATYEDGRATDLTGREANALYTQTWSEVAARNGAQARFAAQIDATLLGDGQTWDMVGIAWYPSRAAFFEITEDPELVAALAHKDAALERSLVIVTERLDAAQRQGIELPEGVPPAVAFARPDPASVPYPPTGDDHPVVLVHFFDYRDHAEYADGRATDLTGREALDLYTANAGDVAPELGIRPLAWFEVEGELIGDGRSWDEVRLNWFPSRATFEALTSNAEWARGLEHREAGLADTYAFITTPLVDMLPMEGEDETS